MKLSSGFLITSFLVGIFMLSATSCNRGYGCKATEKVHTAYDKKGNLRKNKKPKSGLF